MWQAPHERAHAGLTATSSRPSWLADNLRLKIGAKLALNC